MSEAREAWLPRKCPMILTSFQLLLQNNGQNPTPPQARTQWLFITLEMMDPPCVVHVTRARRVGLHFRRCRRQEATLLHSTVKNGTCRNRKIGSQVTFLEHSPRPFKRTCRGKGGNGCGPCARPLAHPTLGFASNRKLNEPLQQYL